MKRLQSQSGYALLVVMGVLTLMLVYLVTVQTSVHATLQQDALGSHKLARAEATESLLALARSGRIMGAPAVQNLSLPTGVGELRVTVQRQVLAPADPLWQEYPFLRPAPGDEILTLRWQDRRVMPFAQRLLWNPQGHRPGAIALPGGSDQPTTATTKIASPKS